MNTQLTFFNTCKLSEPDLSTARAKAGDMQNRILEIMKDVDKLTPIEVWDIYNELYRPALIGSIRRSMTNLTDQGKLVRLDEQKMERYNMPNYYWKAI